MDAIQCGRVDRCRLGTTPVYRHQRVYAFGAKQPILLHMNESSSVRAISAEQAELRPSDVVHQLQNAAQTAPRGSAVRAIANELSAFNLNKLTPETMRDAFSLYFESYDAGLGQSPYEDTRSSLPDAKAAELDDIIAYVKGLPLVHCQPDGSQSITLGWNEALGQNEVAAALEVADNTVNPAWARGNVTDRLYILPTAEGYETVRFHMTRDESHLTHTVLMSGVPEVAEDCEAALRLYTYGQDTPPTELLTGELVGKPN